VSKRLEVRIITNSTMSGYKNGREGDKVMHNFEHGANFVFQTMSLKCTDIKGLGLRLNDSPSAAKTNPANLSR